MVGGAGSSGLQKSCPSIRVQPGSAGTSTAKTGLIYGRVPQAFWAAIWAGWTFWVEWLLLLLLLLIK